MFYLEIHGEKEGGETCGTNDGVSDRDYMGTVPSTLGKEQFRHERIQ